MDLFTRLDRAAGRTGAAAEPGEPDRPAGQDSRAGRGSWAGRGSRADQHSRGGPGAPSEPGLPEEPGGLDGLVGGILAEIASGSRPLRAVAHPLGFYCLPVLREGACGVCVHVFGPVMPGLRRAAHPPPQPAAHPPAPPPEIHCHSWELKSSVLYGRVGNLRVRVLDEPRRPTHRAFEVYSRAGADEIRPTPRLVRWEPVVEQRSARGETYTLAAGEFHTTLLTGAASAATVVLGRSVPGSVDVVLGPVDGPARRVVRRLCDADQTARIAGEAARRISGPDQAA
ncbi:hypothetical protein OG618_31190 [Kitasatospora sp. NBC_01246]|uniref:hypothetical protein n=1 Tax=Kitasatospora sp. NBC_01246 TaxID=2903570 RepID=UPI002E363A20|nr:hypothetical protein [Kitasatospora sp. NBC_01246]